MAPVYWSGTWATYESAKVRLDVQARLVRDQRKVPLKGALPILPGYAQVKECCGISVANDATHAFEHDPDCFALLNRGLPLRLLIRELWGEYLPAHGFHEVIVS